jgi:hypothetical protein
VIPPELTGEMGLEMIGYEGNEEEEEELEKEPLSNEPELLNL